MTLVEKGATPFPLVPVLAVCSCQLCYAYSTTSLLAYVGRQVVHLVHGPKVDVREFIDAAGIYAGMVTAAVMIGRLLSTIPWAMAIERIGRKPALLVGTAALIATQLAYGLSTQLWHAVLCRFLLGVLAPIAVVANMVCREIGGPEHEMKARSYLTGTWSTTTAFASALGGLLAEPVTHFPETFGNIRLLKAFPYLLPNLVGASLSLLSFVSVLVCLPETLDRSKGDWRDTTAQWEEEEGFGGEVPASHQSGLEMQQVQEENVTGSEKSSQTDRPADSWLDVQAEVGFLAKVKSALAIEGSFAGLVCVVTGGFTWILFEEAVSLLMLATSDQGGFEWTPGMAGALLSVQGAASGLWQVFVFPYFAKATTPWLLHAGLSALAVPLIMTFPATSFAYPLGESVLFLVACSAATAFAIIVCMAYTTAWVACMNCTSEDAGLYNGLIYTMMIAGQACASILSGGLTSIGLQEGLPFPFNHFLPFTAGAMALAVVACTSFWYHLKENRLEGQASSNSTL
ncbi:unnamed protein product [Chrysoparadoxa australica]